MGPASYHQTEARRVDPNERASTGTPHAVVAWVRGDSAQGVSMGSEGQLSVTVLRPVISGIKSLGWDWKALLGE